MFSNIIKYETHYKFLFFFEDNDGCEYTTLVDNEFIKIISIFNNTPICIERIPNGISKFTVDHCDDYTSVTMERENRDCYCNNDCIMS